MDPARDHSPVRQVLARSAHFRDLPVLTLDHMSHVARVQTLMDGQLLSNHQGKQGLWIVLSGAVHVSVASGSGAVTAIAVLGEGSFLGLNSLFGSCISQLRECRSVGSTAIAAIAVEALKRMVHHDDAFREHAVKLVVCRFKGALGALADAISAPLSQRLARRLVGQMLAAGELAKGEHPELRLTQELIAQMLGVSRSSVGEELALLEREGIVERRYRALRILDVERLRRIAGPGVTPI